MPDQDTKEENPKNKSNNFLIGIMVITMLVSVGGTFLVFNKLSSLQPQQVVYTGLATQGSGYAKIRISDSLAIDVDALNASIDFGTCNPPTVSNTNASISSLMTEAQLNASNGAVMNCSGTVLPAAIIISNTGNIWANVSMQTDKNGTVILGSTRGEFFYKSTNATVNGGCNSTNIQTDWLKVNLTATRYNVCRNLTTTAGFLNKVYYWVNLTIPNDATTGGAQQTATITFIGQSY